MFRNCKPQCKFKQMGPLWAWWADISSKMPPKAGGRPGEDRGKTGGRPGKSWGAFSVKISADVCLPIGFYIFCNEYCIRYVFLNIFLYV